MWWRRRHLATKDSDSICCVQNLRQKWLVSNNEIAWETLPVAFYLRSVVQKSHLHFGLIRELPLGDASPQRHCVHHGLFSSLLITNQTLLSRRPKKLDEAVCISFCTKTFCFVKVHHVYSIEVNACTENMPTHRTKDGPHPSMQFTGMWLHQRRFFQETLSCALLVSFQMVLHQIHFGAVPLTENQNQFLWHLAQAQLLQSQAFRLKGVFTKGKSSASIWAKKKQLVPNRVLPTHSARIHRSDGWPPAT